jgi:hypothetical protein
MTEPFDSLDYKVNSRPARRAWAPGDCIGKCVDYRQRFMGDKRAYICADTVVLREGLVVMEGDDTGTVHVIVETMKSAWVVWNREKFQAEFAAI